jgi:hypothetical protein
MIKAVGGRACGDRRLGLGLLVVVTAAVPAGFPAVALAAAVLAADGVSLLLVGSAALWLRGEQVPVGDLDVVIEPGERNLRRLHAAVADLALRPSAVPPPHRLAELAMVTATTSYGRIDCLLERGRQDWARLRGSADRVAVADVSILVASTTDTWALRRRFKG